MRAIMLFMMLTGLLISCAPASRYYYIEDNKIPSPSILDFPITDFVERITATRNPYPGFSFAFGKAVNVKQYIYNIPELGAVVAVSFFPSEEPLADWSVDIFDPKIKPEQLFNTDQIGPFSVDTLGWGKSKIISGLLKGGCVYDFSNATTPQFHGFASFNDRAIVIYSRNKDGSDLSCE